MTLPASGSISMSQIGDEFGDSKPHSLNEFYGKATGIPTSGTISMSQFHGKSSYRVPELSNLTTTYTTPFGKNRTPYMMPIGKWVCVYIEESKTVYASINHGSSWVTVGTFSKAPTRDRIAIDYEGKSALFNSSPDLYLLKDNGDSKPTLVKRKSSTSYGDVCYDFVNKRYVVAIGPKQFEWFTQDSLIAADSGLSGTKVGNASGPYTLPRDDIKLRPLSAGHGINISYKYSEVLFEVMSTDARNVNYNNVWYSPGYQFRGGSVWLPNVKRGYIRLRSNPQELEDLYEYVHPYMDHKHWATIDSFTNPGITREAIDDKSGMALIYTNKTYIGIKQDQHNTTLWYSEEPIKNKSSWKQAAGSASKSSFPSLGMVNSDHPALIAFANGKYVMLYHKLNSAGNFDGWRCVAF